jgi:hypothetical protein
LVAEFGIESILFIRAVNDWRALYDSRSDAERRVAAKEIFSTFIHYSGLFPVNVPHEITNELIKEMDGIIAVDNVPAETLFDKAYDEIRTLLQNGALRRFRFKKIGLKGEVTPTV